MQTLKTHNSVPVFPGHPGEIEDDQLPIIVTSNDVDGAISFPIHSHRRGQLIYAAQGVMSVTTHNGTWLVPPQQAVWVPSGIEHGVSSLGPLSMRFLYIDLSVSTTLHKTCCVLPISPLLRELIREISAFELNDTIDTAQHRLIQVVIDQLRKLTPAPLHLPLPSDRRVRLVTKSLLADPADNRSLSEWGKRIGAGGRTLARLFVQETGMSFGQWRERLRVLTAISNLASGRSVSDTAYELGYASPSAFIVMFKRNLGDSPAQYMA